MSKSRAGFIYDSLEEVAKAIADAVAKANRGGTVTLTSRRIGWYLEKLGLNTKIRLKPGAEHTILLDLVARELSDLFGYDYLRVTKNYKGKKILLSREPPS